MAGMSGGVVNLGGDLIFLEKARRVRAISETPIKTAQADQEEMGRDKMAGNLIANENVDFMLRDFGTTLSSHLENLADRLAPVVYDQMKGFPEDNLVPCTRNVRFHSVEQIAQIAVSIREYGIANPVLIDATVALSPVMAKFWLRIPCSCTSFSACAWLDSPIPCIVPVSWRITRLHPMLTGILKCF